MATTVHKASLIKAKRPDYEDGGLAYYSVVHVTRNGKTFATSGERSGDYASMVQYVLDNAKRLGCPVEICAP